MDTDSTEPSMWTDFVRASGHTGPCETVSFGSGELADRLAAWVADGTKRATAGSLRSLEDEPVPEVGDHWLVVDGSGQAVCVCRTVEVRVGPLSSVDEAFAWDEGEDDRTRASWLAEHRRFFAAEADELGVPDAGDELEVAFERFCVVWPPELADRPERQPDSIPAAFDLTTTLVHLRPGTGAAVLPGGEEFWAGLDERPHLHAGRLVMVARADRSWDHWERHPAGGELVALLEGSATLICELADGEHRIELEGRSGVLVPAGVWHRLIVHEPGDLLTVTAGEGTEHRPC